MYRSACPDDVWTFEKLWGHFQEHELEKRRAERSPTTIDKYGENMRLYVLPYWKDTPIEQFDPVMVEDWLGTLLRKDGRPLAPGTKVKIRNQMRVIFYHDLHRKLLDPKLGPNPIELVRQSGQRAAFSIYNVRAFWATLLTVPLLVSIDASGSRVFTGRNACREKFILTLVRSPKECNDTLEALASH